MSFLAFSLIPFYICWPFLKHLSIEPTLYSLICFGSFVACPSKQTEQVWAVVYNKQAFFFLYIYINKVIIKGGVLKSSCTWVFLYE